ncbi:zinc finger protein [Plasmodium brasilianum]|uniref:Zinc finger protein n=1 Tax=Plasmodium brasilianum TaxID=5824 RepID=A0ACB9Y673_PLABR|nr:zinc finger protein [Plasmodium brasilianum]
MQADDCSDRYASYLCTKIIKFFNLKNDELDVNYIKSVLNCKSYSLYSSIHLINESFFENNKNIKYSRSRVEKFTQELVDSRTKFFASVDENQSNDTITDKQSFNNFIGKTICDYFENVFEGKNDITESKKVSVNKNVNVDISKNANTNKNVNVDINTYKNNTSKKEVRCVVQHKDKAKSAEAELKESTCVKSKKKENHSEEEQIQKKKDVLKKNSNEENCNKLVKVGITCEASGEDKIVETNSTSVENVRTNELIGGLKNKRVDEEFKGNTKNDANKIGNFEFIKNVELNTLKSCSNSNDNNNNNNNNTGNNNGKSNSNHNSNNSGNNNGRGKKREDDYFYIFKIKENSYSLRTVIDFIQEENTKSDEGVNQKNNKKEKKKSKTICTCNGQNHKIYANCLICGKIYCTKIKYKICIFCENQLYESSVINNIFIPTECVDSSPKKTLMAIKNADAFFHKFYFDSGNSYLKEAFNLRDKMLSNSHNEEQTKIIDDSIDWFEDDIKNEFNNYEIHFSCYDDEVKNEIIDKYTEIFGKRFSDINIDIDFVNMKIKENKDYLNIKEFNEYLNEKEKEYRSKVECKKVLAINRNNVSNYLSKKQRENCTYINDLRILFLKENIITGDMPLNKDNGKGGNKNERRKDDKKGKKYKYNVLSVSEEDEDAI